jgi:hypothetical protein
MADAHDAIALLKADHHKATPSSKRKSSIRHACQPSGRRECPDGAATKMLAHYRRKVRANRRRLAKAELQLACFRSRIRDS